MVVRMADTSQAEQPLPAEPHTNGIDLDEEDKNKLRPADIDAVSCSSYSLSLRRKCTLFHNITPVYRRKFLCNFVCSVIYVLVK